ncbi:MAG: sulfurtransferase, partial [Thiohalocapsa sp.]
PFIPRPLGLVACCLALAACSERTETMAPVGDALPAMDTLVSAEWLGDHLGDPDLVVLDCTVLVEPGEDGSFRIKNGRPNFEAGHIPTAGFADLMGELADPESPLEFAVPTPEQFATAMGALGVGNDSRVVLYDAYNSAWAARVWWMLRWIGFDRAAILDGGLNAWKAGDRPLSTVPAERPPQRLTINLRPELIADRDEVLAAVGDDSVQIVDSLPEGHYRGEWAMYERPGHITSAVNVPTTATLDESGRFLSEEQLQALFEGNRDARNITYCGGGIAAASNAFLMTRLGFEDVAIYAASLQEWTADPELPMTTATEFDEFDGQE